MYSIGAHTNVHSQKSFLRHERSVKTCHLLLVFVRLHGSLASLEYLDLGGNSLLALGMCKSDCLVLLRLLFPVFRLVRGLEGGVFPDGSMGVSVHLFDIL